MEWSLTIVALALIAVATVSKPLSGSPITPAILFVSIGLLVGPKVLDEVSISSTSSTARALAEATLALVLFSDSSRIYLGALRREVSVPVRLLGIGLPLTIVLGALAAGVIFGELTFWEAVIVGVILAPTDAALGQAVVTDPRLPSRIRQGLNVESGLNDGICVPLLFIGLALAEAETGTASNHAALALVVEAIGYGVLFGAIAGVIGALVVKLARRHGLMDSAWGQILPAATAALAYGLAAPLGGSGFIAAFVAGFVFGALQRDTKGEATYLLDQLGELTNGVTFIVFGAAIVGPVLSDLTWREALYGVLSLTVVRMLPVAISLLGTHARRPTLAFVGWFGPRGLASIVFTIIVLEDGDLPHASTITVAVVFTIVLSVYAHGLSAQPLTDRYASWYRAHPTDRLPSLESVRASHQRWRRPRTADAGQSK